MPRTGAHLMNLAPRNPQPVTRKRLYGTGAAVLSIAVLWGVITADDAAQMVDLWDKLLGVGGLLLARKNVTE